MYDDDDGDELRRQYDNVTRKLDTRVAISVNGLHDPRCGHMFAYVDEYMIASYGSLSTFGN